jgi:uncharacterized membrane protein YoaK (UPF0700 family)
MPATPDPGRPPAFDHAAFPIGLGFVAGFVDLFGFMAWYGLLVAHVTGNLVFFAYNITQGQYALVMKFAALPIFALSVAVCAWFVGMLTARGRHPFLPAIVAQAAALGACLVAGLVLAPPQDPDDTAVVIAGSLALFAMAMQNTTMRLILNNLPPTTVMTGNITHIVTEAVRLRARSGTAIASTGERGLSSRAKQVGFTLAAFTVGAICGGQAQLRVGYLGLLLPIAVLLGLLPFGRAALRAATGDR